MLRKLLLQDIIFQFRHGFYYAYLFITLLYIGILIFIPDGYRPFWSVFIIFTDPGTLGFFFIGAIVMLERNQQLLTYMFITPVTLKNYLLSKVVTLTIIAWLTSILISLFALGTSVSYGLLTVSVVLCSFFFTFIGLSVSVNTFSINQFLFKAVSVMAFFYLPVLSYLGWVSTPLLEIFPSFSSIFLIDFAIQSPSHGWHEVFVHLGLLLLWTFIAYFFTYRRFETYILVNTGEQKGVSI